MTDIVDRLSTRLHDAGAVGDAVVFDTPVPTAAAAADRLGCEVGAIANSLVFAVDGEPLLIIASGAHRVDTRRVAAGLGLGRIRRASAEFVQEATGQPIGGVAPIGHPRSIRTVVDRRLESYGTVWAGAGTPHAMFPTSYAELVRITDGTAADVAESRSE